MSTKRREKYTYDQPLNTPVVAIDFGPSRSAMSQTFVGNESFFQDLILPRGCDTECRKQGKIQTVLLLRVRPGIDRAQPITSPKDVEVVAFGDHAESLFCSTPLEECADFVFLKWFKMALWKRGAVSASILPPFGCPSEDS